MIESIQSPCRIQLTVTKRKADDPAYRLVEADEPTWHEPDGTEITDPERIAELEAARRPASESRVQP